MNNQLLTILLNNGKNGNKTTTGPDNNGKIGKINGLKKNGKNGKTKNPNVVGKTGKEKEKVVDGGKRKSNG